MEKRIEALKVQSLKMLTKAGYSATATGVSAVIDMWYQRKKPLIDFLSKHPNWDAEKFMIRYDRDYMRPFDPNGFFNFFDYLQKLLDGKHNYDGLNRFKFILTDYKPTQLVTKAQEEVLQTAFPELKSNIREGQKISKVIGKVTKLLEIDQDSEYNKRYAVFSDLMNPLGVKRHTNLSLNPIDFWLMSNGNSWHSCHSILPSNGGAGGYSNGTEGYMLDDCSMIMYTVDANYSGNCIEEEPKIHRQVFAYKGGLLLQSRLYPQESDKNGSALYDDVRGWVQEIISGILDVPNSWTVEKSANTTNKKVYKNPHSILYPDWEYDHYPTTLSTLKGCPTIINKLVIGRIPLCVCCGQENANSGYIVCKNKYCG